MEESSAVQNVHKDHLEAMCRTLRIPVTPSLMEHNLAALICEKNGESLPPQFSQPLYHAWAVMGSRINYISNQ